VFSHTSIYIKGAKNKENFNILDININMQFDELYNQLLKEYVIEDVDFFTEGLWANINAKKKRGGKSASKGSKAYKAAKKAGDKLNNSKHSDEELPSEDAESSPGRVKRAGASCKGSVTELRKRAKKYGGEKGKMYHWCANMKGGKKKKSESEEEDAEKKVSKTRAKCQAKAKRKYDVWPSAYASGYVQKCVNRGGKIK
jgi:hypothetical protein